MGILTKKKLSGGKPVRRRKRVALLPTIRPDLAGLDTVTIAVVRKAAAAAVGMWIGRHGSLPRGVSAEELIQDTATRFLEAYRQRSAEELRLLAPRVSQQVLRTVVDLRVRKNAWPARLARTVQTRWEEEVHSHEADSTPRFREFVIRYMSVLSPTDARITHAVLWRDRSHAEIAKELGISRQSLGRAWRRILRDLLDAITTERRRDFKLDIELETDGL